MDKKRPLSRVQSGGAVREPNIHMWRLLDSMKKDPRHHSSFILLSKSLRTPDFSAVTRDEMEGALLQLMPPEELLSLVEICPEVFFISMKNGESRDVFLYQYSVDLFVRKNKLDIDPKLTELASIMCQEMCAKMHGSTIGRQLSVNPPSPTLSSSLKTIKCQFSVKPGFPVMAFRLKCLFDIGENDEDFHKFLHMDVELQGNFVWSRELSKHGILTGVIYIHFDSENSLTENLLNKELPRTLIYNTMPVVIDYIRY